MPLERFIPLSPDPNITTSSDMGMAQFGHLNTIVDYLNGTYALTDIKIAGINNTPGYIDFSANPSGSTTAVGAIRTYQDGTNLLPTLTFIESGDVYQSKYSGGINNIFIQDNAGVNMPNGTGVYQGDYVGRRNGATATLFRQALTYNGDGTTRRGRYSMSVAESSGFGSYQFVLTQYGNLKVNISGHGAGSYIDDAISPTTAYNIHAGNIINTIGSTLPLLSLDVNGLTKHVFQTNGNVSFNNTADMAAIVGIKGSGSTSATISLLVQNSAGNTAFQVKDDLNANFQGRIQIEYDKISFLGSPSNTYIEQSLGLGIGFYSAAVSNQIMINAQPKIIVKDTGASRASTLIVGHNVPTTDAADVSALLEVRSDATYLKGFLPPRMTTAQKNLIASPAIGLQIFDTDLNRPCFYNGAWVTL